MLNEQVWSSMGQPDIFSRIVTSSKMYVEFSTVFTYIKTFFEFELYMKLFPFTGKTHVHLICCQFFFKAQIKQLFCLFKIQKQSIFFYIFNIPQQKFLFQTNDNLGKQQKSFSRPDVFFLIANFLVIKKMTFVFLCVYALTRNLTFFLFQPFITIDTDSIYHHRH